MYLKTTSNPERLELAADLLGLENKNGEVYQQSVEKIKNKYQELAKQSKEDIKLALWMTTPLFTKLGIGALTFGSNTNKDDVFFNIICGMVRLIGVPLTIGGIILDIVKLPIAAVTAVYKTGETLVYKALGTMPDKVDYSLQKQDIYTSFLNRLKKTLLLLCILELEQSENIIHLLENSDSETSKNLAIMSLLYTAFDSRNLPNDQLQLANLRILTKENCPSEGKKIFQKMNEIKKLLNEILPPDNDEAIKTLLAHIDKIRALINSNGNQDVLDADVLSSKDMPPLIKLVDILLELKADMSRCFNSVKSSPAEAVKTSHKSAKPINAYVEKRLQENHGSLYGVLQDPITCKPLENPVIANDGVIYSETTAANLKRNLQKGIKGIIIRGYKPADKETIEAANMATSAYTANGFNP